MKKEIRNLKTPVKVEKREDGTIKSIVGYPIVYNKDSEDMGFLERIAPGAATKSLRVSDVRGLKNHDASLIFARSGVNLTLTEDKKGVRMEATPIDTHNYREVSKEIDAGLLDGQSFAFTIKEDEWRDLDTDKPQRTITEFDMIFDVGPVTYPAYSDTTVGLRTLDAAREAANETIPDDKITISFKDKEYEFTDEKSFNDAVEIIRSLVKPMLPADDNTDSRSDDQTEPDGKDETLDKINETIKRYSK